MQAPATFRRVSAQPAATNQTTQLAATSSSTEGQAALACCFAASTPPTPSEQRQALKPRGLVLLSVLHCAPTES
jgi:hypothetical protein